MLRKGITDVFSGNGSDELFGGYKKYQDEYMRSNSSVRKTMYQDVINSWSTNLERDTSVCNNQSVRLKLPFTEPGKTTEQRRSAVAWLA